MATLLKEYINRKKGDFLWAANDGLCFFNKNGQPAFIMHTNASKSLSTCAMCNDRNTIVIELFRASPNYVISRIIHMHVTPDEDLIRLIKSKIQQEMHPVIISNQRDIEIWMWQFFSKSNLGFNNPEMIAILQKQKHVKEPMKSIEQMAICAVECKPVFDVFYNGFISIVAGRKYLLFN